MTFKTPPPIPDANTPLSDEDEADKILRELVGATIQNGEPTKGQFAEAKSALLRLLVRQRIEEHHAMLGMIKSTNMQGQLEEYWHAGNVRLATLQEEYKRLEGAS